jgi:hypothetical protein
MLISVKSLLISIKRHFKTNVKSSHHELDTLGRLKEAIGKRTYSDSRLREIHPKNPSPAARGGVGLN